MDRSFDTLDELTARLELDAAAMIHCANDDEAKATQWAQFQSTLRGLKMEMESSRQRLDRAEEQNRKQAEAQADAIVHSAEIIHELEETKQSLHHAREQAESANRAKSQFLANMTHEIRTPLNSILGFADIMRRGSVSPGDTAEYLEIIVNSGRHLVELVDEVLDVSKVETGRMEIERQPCELRAVIKEVVGLLSPKAAERDTALIAQVSDDIPGVITTDRFRLRQILLNLIGNAIKFTSHGSIRVDCELQKTNNSSPELQQKLAINITDTGIGIAPDRLEAIFEPFVQADSSMTRQYGGTGLGLTLSRSLAELLGGSLSVTSVFGVGSTFTVVIDPAPMHDGFPAASAAPAVVSDAVVSDIAAPTLPAQQTPHRGRLLIVDDVVTNRRYLRLLLKRAGFEIVEAENGQKALDAIEAQDFDLVLMDLQMPVMDGYQATEQLRQSGIDIPVIAVAANAFEASLQKSLKAGCNAWLTKPVDPDALLDEISKQLELVTG